jgi:hypothetical protein
MHDPKGLFNRQNLNVDPALCGIALNQNGKSQDQSAKLSSKGTYHIEDFPYTKQRK